MQALGNTSAFFNKGLCVVVWLFWYVCVGPQRSPPLRHQASGEAVGGDAAELRGDSGATAVPVQSPSLP